MTARKALEDRFIWKKDDISITRALVFLEEQQKVSAETTLSAAKKEIMIALGEAFRH